MYEVILDTFYRGNSTIVKRARDDVAEQNKGRKSGEIANLIQCDLFKFINWEFTPVERENIGVIGYVNRVGKPTIYELPDEEYERVCDEIFDSFLQNERNMYTNSIVAGSIANHRNAREENDAVYAGNVQTAEELFDAKIAAAQSRLNAQNVMTRIGDTKKDINADITANKSKLAVKKGEIEKLQKSVNDLRDKINEDSRVGEIPDGGDIPDPRPIREMLFVVLAQLAAMGRPFVSLGRKLSKGGKGFFGWIGEHCQVLSTFIRKIATQPAFWVALLFAAVNGSFSHRLFDDMFTDTLMVLMFTGICTSVFSILPFHVSKHIKECGENPNRATKTLLTFESVLASLFAVAYPVLTSQHSHIYADNEQTQFVAATAVGLLPIVTACIIGFMNYWKLKGNGETPTLTDVIETIMSEVTDQSGEAEQQPEETDSASGNENQDNNEEIMIEEVQPS